MPEVSVIIPVYNRAGVVSDAIESVLAQTFEDYELIIVDDGSTDSSVDMVRAHEDPRIALHVHERNRGEAAARNTGIAQASGRYVAFLDSDDLWRPDKLKRQISAMRRRELPVTCTWFSIEEVPDKPAKRVRTPQSRDWFWTLLFSNPLAPTTMVVERVWFDRVGAYDTSIRYGTDTDWLLRFSRQASLTIIEEDLALRRWCDPGVAGLLEPGSDPLASFCRAWTTPGSQRPSLSGRELRRFKAGVTAHRASACWRKGEYAGMVGHLAHVTVAAPGAMASYCADRARAAFARPGR